MSEHPPPTTPSAAGQDPSGDVPAGDPDEALDFGPSGYLPERAAKRARKIVLRAPLGMQWIVASLVAGVVVLIAGIWYLQVRDSPPPAPWTAVAALEDLAVSAYNPDLEALIVTASGRVRVFAGADGISYCPASNRLEEEGGDGIWSLTGRGLAGTPSLEEHPAQVTAGVLYIDPTFTSPSPPGTDDPEEPGCS